MDFGSHRRGRKAARWASSWLGMGLAICLAGCGDTTAPAALANPGSPQVIQGPDGERVTIPAAALTRPATLTIQPLGGLPNLKQDVVVDGFVLNLGGAETQGSLQIDAPDPGPGEHYLAVQYEGSQPFIPLATREEGGRLLADLDLPSAGEALADAGADGRDVRVVTLSATSVAAYQPWAGYNAYLLPQNGTQTQLVVDGAVNGTFPQLDGTVLVLVHGLGDRLDDRWRGLAQTLYTQMPVDHVLFFEYDTQDSIVNTGQRLSDFYDLLDQHHTGSYLHVAHSLGCLVSRQAFQHNQSVNGRAFLICGPHNGTPAIEVLQSNLSGFQRFARDMILNDVMVFTDAQHNPTDVDVNRPSFNELGTTHAQVRQTLNAHEADEAAWNRATLAGTVADGQYALLSTIFGLKLDDGLVNQTSANLAIGQAQTFTVAANHSNAVTDPTSLVDMVDFLTAP